MDYLWLAIPSVLLIGLIGIILLMWVTAREKSRPNSVTDIERRAQQQSRESVAKFHKIG